MEPKNVLAALFVSLILTACTSIETCPPERVLAPREAPRALSKEQFFVGTLPEPISNIDQIAKRYRFEFWIEKGEIAMIYDTLNDKYIAICREGEVYVNCFGG